MDVMSSVRMSNIFSVFYTFCVFTKFAFAVQESTNGKSDQECHNYAGGHVYPGEAFRVPVSDHSLHLSKAKSGYIMQTVVVDTPSCTFHPNIWFTWVESL